jgi:hypothetical protein
MTSLILDSTLLKRLARGESLAKILNVLGETSLLDVDTDYPTERALEFLAQLTPHYLRIFISITDKHEACRYMFANMEALEWFTTSKKYYSNDNTEFDDINWPQVLTRVRKGVELAFKVE